MKTIGGRLRAAVLMGAAASVLVFAGGAKAQNQNSNGNGDPNSNDNTWTGKSPVLAVVGDISCQPGTEQAGESKKETCTDPKVPYAGTNNPTVPPTYSLWQSQEATANQIEAMKPVAVALLGDLQYQVGRYSDFEQSFDLTYGAFKKILMPAPGNHEFYDEHGETGVAGYGYFSYFNGFQIDTTDANSGQPLAATISDPCPSNPACGPGATPTIDLSFQPIPRADGQAGHFEESGGLATATYYNGPSAGQPAPVGVGDGWYSYNIGSWHLISLNIECSTQPGGCSALGPWFASELAWLKKDLEENHSACTLAYWHQPTFSATNGITPEGVTAQAFWQLLYEHKADLVLNGHDHLYAHYRPLDPDGNYDPHKGIRQFTVGTGGETLDPIYATTETSSAGAQPGYPTLTGETNQEDPSGNTSFNATNLEAYTGDYWGVMALTLDENGYKWDYESALAGPTVALNGPTSGSPGLNANGTYSDKGAGTCHGPANRW
ncbi:MAG: metallophosphoesterase family protein [Candidatus Acidiferrales bacterium]